MKKMGMALGLGMMSASTAFGWGDIGHQTVGAIAEQNLSPAAKTLVYGILGPEPFAVAAIWPDIVRSDPRYNSLAPYHYVQIREGKSYLQVPAAKRAEKDSFTYLTQVPPLLLRPEIPRDQKMILLRYLIHIVGDIHQPLHVTDGTDFGANSCDVKWREPVTGKIETGNLHSIWDEGLIEIVRAKVKKADRIAQEAEAKKTGKPIMHKKRWFGYKEYAEQLVGKNGRKPQSMETAETFGAETFGRWIDETFALTEMAYPKTKKPTVPGTARPYCAPQGPKAPPPFLDQKYIDAAIPIMESQIVKGGMRLAGLLNTLAEKIPVGTTTEDEKKLLNALLLKNERPAPDSSASAE